MSDLLSGHSLTFATNTTLCTSMTLRSADVRSSHIRILKWPDKQALILTSMEDRWEIHVFIDHYSKLYIHLL